VLYKSSIIIISSSISIIIVFVAVVSASYSTERSELYAPDTQQTATLDLKHRRRNPTSPTPTYGSYTPDMVRVLSKRCLSHPSHTEIILSHLVPGH